MRTIIPYRDNPALREIAKPVALEDIRSPRMRELISDMRALLAKEKHGVAIAASQVGEPLQLFVVSGKALAADKRRASDEDDGPIPAMADQIYINPELVKLSRGRKDKHEGCLSIRGFWGEVPRAEKATLRAYDEEGRLFTRGASGFLAHVFQHEMDHLNGTLYVDKASRMYDEKEERDEE